MQGHSIVAFFEKVAAIMIQLLKKKRSIVVQQMMEFLEETETDVSPQSRIRRQKPKDFYLLGG